MTRYEQHAADLAAKIEHLKGRAERFAARPTLAHRVPAILAEVAALEATLPKAQANARWVKEIHGEWA